MVTSYDSGTEPVETRSRISGFFDGDLPNSYQADGRRYGKRAKPGEIDYARLFEAMRYSRRVLTRFREERTAAIREYVGYHYSEGGSTTNVPLNLIARYVQIVSRNLVPKTPKIMLSTRVKGGQPAVSAMQDWINQRLKDMQFAKSLQRWVVDALFSLGIMKVALGTPADAAVSGYVSPAGEPFAEVVDLDDFVFDAGARDFRSVSYVGHRYRMPREVAEKLDYFDKKAMKWLQGAVPSEGTQNNQEGDERVTQIGQGYQGGETRDFEEMVDLWEVYVPRKKKVLTFASDAGGVPAADCPPLREQEWVGPACGPYHYLAFMPVPGNPMPKAPVQDLIDLHKYVNALYNKLIDQSLRQKSVLPVRGGAMDDARNLKQAGDGEMFQAENADQMREVSFGGPNPTNAQFSVHLGDVFNKMAGNLDLLSGAAPQSKTATQDKILSEGASAGVADMQENTVVGITGVADSLCWFWWYHPQKVMSTTRSIAGAEDISIERNLYPAAAATPDRPAQGGLRRDGRYEDLNCRIDPYSLVYRTPQQRLMFLTQFAKDWVPAMPMLGQQGVVFDAQATFKAISEYADEPDVMKIFTVAEPIPRDGGTQDSSRMPTQTSREYIRKSQGADTEASRAADMSNAGAEFAAEQQQS